MDPDPANNLAQDGYGSAALIVFHYTILYNIFYIYMLTVYVLYCILLFSGVYILHTVDNHIFTLNKTSVFSLFSISLASGGGRRGRGGGM